MSDLRNTLPCGCWRAVVKRSVAAFDEQGTPKLDVAGQFVMTISEEVEDGFCEEHTKVIAERQVAVAKALAAGTDPNEAMLLMEGASPFPMLGAGVFEDDIDVEGVKE